MSGSILMVAILVAVVLAAVLAARKTATTLWEGFVLAVLTVVIGVPLWITCDSHLVRLLPAPDWFDPREPFAPYFLLYLPLSITMAIPLAAGLIALARLLAGRTPFPVRHR